MTDKDVQETLEENAPAKKKATPKKPPAKSANIYQRMARVMDEVGNVPKNLHNEFHHYDYAGEQDILNTLRPLFVKHGLALDISVCDLQVDGAFRRVGLMFTITNTDKPEEQVITTWYGEAEDKKGDKALYKAYTGCLKYYLLKTFLVATGDDPERDSIVAEKQQAAMQEGGGNGGGVPASKPRQGDSVSQNQLKYIWKLSDDLGFEPKDHEAIKKRYKVEHTKELTVDQASELIGKLKGLVKDVEKAKKDAEKAKAPAQDQEPPPPEEEPPPPSPELEKGGDKITDELASEIADKQDAVTEKIERMFLE